MVGLLAGTEYPEGTGQMEKGDRLVLLTAGVPARKDPATTISRSWSGAAPLNQP